MNFDLKEPLRKGILLITIASLLGLIVMSLMTSTPIEDFVLFIQLVNGDHLLIDIISLVLGGIGFIYYFVFPALPLFLDVTERDFINQVRNLVKVIVASSISSYCLQNIFMLGNIPNFFPLIPLLIFVVTFVYKTVIYPIDDRQDITLHTESNDGSGISKRMIIIGTIIVSFALILRFVAFQSIVVEVSDGWTYHTLIDSIFANDFMFNETTAVWAPLYFFQGALMNTFTSSALVSLKVLSFYYSLIVILPILIILDTLNFKQTTRNYVLFMGSIAIIVYPWIMSMAAINLQDSILTFFVVSFFALLYSNGRDNALLAGAAGALSFLSRYSWGILGPLGFIFLVVKLDKDKLKTIAAFSITFIAIVGSWVIRNLLVAGVLFSTTDESRFSIEFLIPGIVDSLKRLLYDKHGMNSVFLWLPIIFVVVYVLVKSKKRNHLIDWFKSKELVFLIFTLAFQVLVLSLFESHQARFLLSVIWVIPVILVILVNGLDINREISLIGMAAFGFIHSLFLIHTYWVFEYGRLPLHELVDLHRIIDITMPPAVAWTSAAIACVILALYLFYEFKIRNESH